MLRIAILTLMVFALAACSDGSGRGSTPPPPAPNTPPVIAAIADVTVPANTTTGSITFTVSDAEDDDGALNVTVASADPALLPDTGVALEGSAGDRELVLTPAADVTGTTTISVTVTDSDQASATASFILTITTQTVAFSSTVRDIFALDATTQPREINALTFTQDGEDFDDLVDP